MAPHGPCVNEATHAWASELRRRPGMHTQLYAARPVHQRTHAWASELRRRPGMHIQPYTGLVVPSTTVSVGPHYDTHTERLIALNQCPFLSAATTTCLWQTRCTFSIRTCEETEPCSHSARTPPSSQRKAPLAFDSSPESGPECGRPAHPSLTPSRSPVPRSEPRSRDACRAMKGSA